MSLYRRLFCAVFISTVAWISSAQVEEYDRSITLTDQNGVHEFELLQILPDRIEVQQGQFKFFYNKSDIRKVDNRQANALLNEANSLLSRIEEEAEVGKYLFLLQEATPFRERLDSAQQAFDWLIPEIGSTLDRMQEATKGMEAAMRIHAESEALIRTLRSNLQAGEPLDATWADRFNPILRQTESIPFDAVRSNLKDGAETVRLELKEEIDRSVRHHTQSIQDRIEEANRKLASRELSREDWGPLVERIETSLARIPLKSAQIEQRTRYAEWLKSESVQNWFKPSGQTAPEGDLAHDEDSSDRERLEALVGLLFLVSLALGGGAFILVRAGKRATQPSQARAGQPSQGEPNRIEKPAPLLPAPAPEPVPSSTPAPETAPSPPPPAPSPTPPPKPPIQQPPTAPVGTFGLPAIPDYPPAPPVKKIDPLPELPASTKQDLISRRRKWEAKASPRVIALSQPEEDISIGPVESGREAAIGRRLDSSTWDTEEPLLIGKTSGRIKDGLLFAEETPRGLFPLGEEVGFVLEGRDGLRLYVLSLGKNHNGGLHSLHLIHERVNECRRVEGGDSIWVIGPEGLTVVGVNQSGIRSLGAFGFRESLTPPEPTSLLDPRQRPVWCGAGFLVLPSPNGVLHGLGVAWEAGQPHFRECWTHPSSTPSRRIDSNLASYGGRIFALDEEGSLLRIDLGRGEIRELPLPAAPFGSIGSDAGAVILILSEEEGSPRLVRLDAEHSRLHHSVRLAEGDEFEIHTLDDGILVESPDALILFESDDLSERWKFSTGGRRLTHLHWDSTQIALTLEGQGVTILGKNSGVRMWEVNAAEQGFRALNGALIDSNRMVLLGETSDGGGAFIRLVD